MRTTLASCRVRRALGLASLSGRKGRKERRIVRRRQRDGRRRDVASDEECRATRRSPCLLKRGEKGDVSGSRQNGGLALGRE